MSGIIGFTGQIDHRETILRKMADRIVHRGPDEYGFHIWGESDSDSIALGVRIHNVSSSLSADNGPVYSNDGSLVIVLDGRIYNLNELKDELASRNHSFITGSDAEIILHGYEEYGKAIAGRLRGMFAFVIWDKRNNTLFGARDHFGMKHLYYTVTDRGNLLFGSEIKSFLEHPEFKKQVNENALRPYLTLQYSATEETFFKGTYKLPPAHTFTFHNGKLYKERYWDIDFSTKTTLSYDECVERLEELVRESVKSHGQSGSTVASFLSGGVDSSYITAILKPQDTFSVGFDEERFDETNEAKALSEHLGISHHIRHLTAEQCFSAFPKIQYHMDEPQSNPSSVPLYFLAQLASEQVSVVLSGEGADEIFGGYAWYDESPLMRKYKRLPGSLRRVAASVAEALPYFKGRELIIRSSGVPENYFVGQAYIFSDKEVLRILKPKYQKGLSVKELTAPIYARAQGLCELEKKQYLDIHLWVPGDILLKADKMCMAHSLEVRAPYLDRLIFEAGATLPPAYKLDGTYTKAILRTAANKTLPDAWATRPKKGFPVPIRKWLAEDKFYSIVKTAFESDVADEYFDRAALIKLLDDHKSGRANNARKIWTLYTFLVWHMQFFS